mmetsp:Transcript_26818/g.42576  ORF Transcript_26818/g.42576 Transcript_26818/m.42576 type:complete len:209 (-) Transcript_26818:229-855(-)
MLASAPTCNNIASAHATRQAPAISYSRLPRMRSVRIPTRVGAMSRRKAIESTAGAGLTLSSLSLGGAPGALAYDGGTPTVEINVVKTEDIACPAGSPPKMRCIRVYGKINNKYQKTAANSEVYGYIEYDDGNPALWNDDIKRIANIANIKPGENTVTFDLQLRKLAGLTGNEEVVFKKLTARMYFSNFYSAQPLGIVECDELDTADCE